MSDTNKEFICALIEAGNFTDIRWSAVKTGRNLLRMK